MKSLAPITYWKISCDACPTTMELLREEDARELAFAWSELLVAKFGILPTAKLLVSEEDVAFAHAFANNWRVVNGKHHCADCTVKTYREAATNGG